MRFLLAATGLVSLSLAAPSANLVARETDVEATDRFSFRTSITAFEAARITKIPASLDWSSDGCSSAPDNPLGFDFIYSCHRHDFGYRNFKKQSRFTDANKLAIDNKFKDDMYAQCASELLQNSCKLFANAYYAAVRAFGSKRALEVMEEQERKKREASIEVEKREAEAEAEIALAKE